MNINGQRPQKKLAIKKDERFEGLLERTKLSNPAILNISFF